MTCFSPLSSLSHIWLFATPWTAAHQATLCDPMDCSVPGSSVDGIFQARVLEWVAISISRGSSQPKDRTRISGIASRFFTSWATGEAPIVIIGDTYWAFISLLQPSERSTIVISFSYMNQLIYKEVKLLAQNHVARKMEPGLNTNGSVYSPLH